MSPVHVTSVGANTHPRAVSVVTVHPVMSKLGDPAGSSLAAQHGKPLPVPSAFHSKMPTWETHLVKWQKMVLVRGLPVGDPDKVPALLSLAWPVLRC